MSEWKNTKLEEVLTFGNGKVKPKNNGAIPIYGGNGILGFGNKSNYDGETIIIGRVGAYCGSVYYENKPIWVSDNALSAKPKGKNNAKFLYYFLKQIDLNQWAGGSSHPLVTQTLLNSLEFSICINPNTQASIASILSSLDDKINLLHRQNATLEKMGETLFRQWFVERRPEPVEGKAKEEWKNGRVGDLIRILSGFAFKSSSFVESGKYRLITIKGVQDGYLELTNSDRIDELPEQMPEFCKLQIGDILLSLTGNVGRCCLVDTTYLLLNQRVAKLHPINERDKAFTYFLFRQPQIKQLLEDMAKGTAQANLSPVETSNMELKIPDDNTLNEFSSLVTPWVEKLIFNKKSIQTLTQIRDSLLPKLMSGEIRVL